MGPDRGGRDCRRKIKATLLCEAEDQQQPELERDGEYSRAAVIALVPSPTTVPPAATEQQNDKYDDEDCGGVHDELSSFA